MNKQQASVNVFVPTLEDKKLVESFINDVLPIPVTWNDLMPVVEKIKETKFGISFQMSFDIGLSIVCVYDHDNEFQICQVRYSTSEKTAIETTWLCVIEFITWYNNTQTKKQ